MFHCFGQNSEHQAFRRFSYRPLEGLSELWESDGKYEQSLQFQFSCGQRSFMPTSTLPDKPFGMKSVSI